MEWLPIESAPKDGREMYVVRGFDIKPNKKYLISRYTTDPYCVWPDGKGNWARWPHPFPPTHWMPLPPPPVSP